MYFLRIAFRNLFRRRKRTLVAAAVLAVAVLFFLALDSFLSGMMEVSFGNMIDFETAHVQLAREEFFAREQEGELPLEQTLAFSHELEEKLQGREEVESLTPVLDFQANMIAGREEFPVRVRALDSESFREVFQVEEYLVAGEFITAGDEDVVIGQELAEMLNLEVGDFYTLHFQDNYGSLNTMQGEVRGIVSTPHPDLNQNMVLASREYAAGPAGVEEERVSMVLLALTGRRLAADTARELEDELAGFGSSEDLGGSGVLTAEAQDSGVLTARTYREAEEMLQHLEAWVNLENYVILLMILLIGTIGIVNIIVLSALERTREIGIMKAMGLKEKEIIKIFSLEAGGIGLLGGLVGCLLGAVTVGMLARFGLDIRIIYGDALDGMGIPMTGRLYGVWNQFSFLLIFIFVLVLTLIASLLPSFWAARKDPIDAIYER